METIKFLRKLKENNLKIFSFCDLKKLLGTDNTNTAYKFIERLIKKEIVRRLKNGLYIYEGDQIDDFQIANFLYYPSYISLESALNFYGILSQFPYVITSVTPKKTKKIETEGKNFEYVHFAPKKFFGYVKQKNFIIATKEKALFDILYLISKGLRKISLDELDLTSVDKKIFAEYVKGENFKPLKKLSEQIL